jgi:hypothetical protein
VRHEAANAILEKKRLAQEEYQSTMRADQGASVMAADQGAALEDIYAGMPGKRYRRPPVEPEAPIMSPNHSGAAHYPTEPQEAPR